MNILKAPAISLVMVLCVACSSNNPKRDLKARIDQRIKQHPYVKVLEIKKYVEENEMMGHHEVKFAITYEVTEDCFADQQSMYGITVADCKRKAPGGLSSFSARAVEKGSQIHEDATLDYISDTKKLSSVEFSARNQYKNPEFEK